MLVGVCQFTSDRDVQTNLAKATRFIEEGAESGAAMMIFPEYTMYWDSDDHGAEAFRRVAEPLSGPFVAGLAQAARDAEIPVIAGVIEASEEPDGLAYNTSVVLDADGQLLSSYRKSHLFDAFGHRESSELASGEQLHVPMVTPIGMVGLMVCYELRFPEGCPSAGPYGSRDPHRPKRLGVRASQGASLAHSHQCPSCREWLLCSGRRADWKWIYRMQHGGGSHGPGGCRASRGRGRPSPGSGRHLSGPRSKANDTIPGAAEAGTLRRGLRDKV